MAILVLISIVAILMTIIAIRVSLDARRFGVKPSFVFPVGILLVSTIGMMLLYLAAPILVFLVPHQDQHYFFWLVPWVYVCGLLPGFLSLIPRKPEQKRIPLPHDGEAHAALGGKPPLNS